MKTDKYINWELQANTLTNVEENKGCVPLALLIIIIIILLNTIFILTN